jgi:hypothetical protein
MMLREGTFVGSALLLARSLFLRLIAEAFVFIIQSSAPVAADLLAN